MTVPKSCHLSFKGTAVTLVAVSVLLLYLGMKSLLEIRARMPLGRVYERNNGRRPLLVDVTEEFLSGWTYSNGEENLQPAEAAENISHRILWYNLPDWISLPTINRCMNSCAYKNCNFTTDRQLIRQSSAVIFCISATGIGTDPPLGPSERPPNQVWVFFSMESALYMDRNYKKFRPAWKDSMNWSMNYRVDSDITVPYGYLFSRAKLPGRNYTEIFRNKTKFAAWVVSNCNTLSLREKFVEKLKKKYGLEIDIYGSCGQKLQNDPYEMINANYKFYLSLENSLCADYVTEKFFRYYPLNTIPLVRGGANYAKLVPDGTYINTADFDSFEKLANYLKHVGSSEILYTGYLRRKDKYDSVSVISDVCPSFCAICRKINNLEANRKTYSTVPNYLETCYKPDDIFKMDYS